MNVEYMKVSEVAEYLRLSKGNVYLKIKREVFPKDVVKRIGKSYRFEVKRLKEWIDKGGNGNGNTDGGNGDVGIK